MAEEKFHLIFNKLKDKGIFAKITTLKEHDSQGFMSAVYTVYSNIGFLIIHIIKPVTEWKNHKIWEKIKAIGDLLENFPNIPAAKIYLSGKIKKEYFLVQKKLEGKPAGKRRLSFLAVKDDWVKNNPDIFIPEIQKIIADIHNIKCVGYGWPLLRAGGLEGKYRTWKDFFLKEAPLWMKSVKSGDRKNKNRLILEEEFPLIEEYVKYFFKNIPKVEPSLIHGDAINPSNILIKNKKITGVVDWEWSIIGDPAWEFCDIGWWPYLNKKSLLPYMGKNKKHKDMDVDLFIDRIRLYIPMWLLWGCHMHSEKPNGSLYFVLRTLLNEKLKNPL